MVSVGKVKKCLDSGQTSSAANYQKKDPFEQEENLTEKFGRRKLKLSTEASNLA